VLLSEQKAESIAEAATGSSKEATDDRGKPESVVERRAERAAETSI
jgi:hypothetical protein